jgi:hypothetical protein
MPHNRRPPMPQVTAMDGQFGTHTLYSEDGMGLIKRVPHRGPPGAHFATPTT